MGNEDNQWSQDECEAVVAQLERLLKSELFTHADRLGRFLAFVVHQTLSGNASRLNQYLIAIEVFDRDESFDPTVDAIVRVEAGRLRSKLLEYYDELGCNDPIRVSLPKRSYAAAFEFRSIGGDANSIAVPDTNRSDQGIHKPLGRAKKTEKFTIAVLPFANMSPDPEQEYFADGITEDLITDLSKISTLSVISRQSTFAYKGVAITIQQVCKELQANIVLEGSVRKIANRVRITAQLIDGVSGGHIWAHRYDEELGDIFEIQDEVNRKIVNALQIQLSEDDQNKLIDRGTGVIDAYDYVLRGMQESQIRTFENSARARYCFERALELDPEYAAAYAHLAMNYIVRWVLDWSKQREDSVDIGFELAKQAVALDGKLAFARAILCWAHLWQGNHDEAIAEGTLAVELDPSDVVALERLALCRIWTGKAESSLALIEKAEHLNPNQSYGFARGVAMFMLQNYDRAIYFLSEEFERNPNFIPSGLYLAASQAISGYQSEASTTITSIRKVNPDCRLAQDVRTHFQYPEDRNRYVEGLKQAGLT